MNLARWNVVLKIPKVTPLCRSPSRLLQSSVHVQFPSHLPSIKSWRVNKNKETTASNTSAIHSASKAHLLKLGNPGPKWSWSPSPRVLICLDPRFDEEQQRDFRTKSHVWSKPVTNYRSDNWYIDARSQHRARPFQMAWVTESMGAGWIYERWEEVFGDMTENDGWSIIDILGRANASENEPLSLLVQTISRYIKIDRQSLGCQDFRYDFSPGWNRICVFSDLQGRKKLLDALQAISISFGANSLWPRRTIGRCTRCGRVAPKLKSRSVRHVGHGQARLLGCKAIWDWHRCMLAAHSYRKVKTI